MGTESVFIKVKDITDGKTYVFITAKYDRVINKVSSGYDQTLAAFFLKYPTFANEVSFFGNLNQDLADSLADFGIPNALPHSIDYFRGHSWEFIDGTTHAVTVSGSGNQRYISIGGYDFVPSWNQNTQPLTSPVYYDPETLKGQYVRIFYHLSYATTPATVNGIGMDNTASYSSPSLPIEINASQAAIDFWQPKYTYFSTDPYDGAGDSGPGGGGGDFDYTGDPPDGWDPTSPPGISATDTGFVTLYNPNTAELKALADFLWSSSFDLDLFKRIFNDPMDLFIGLSILPVSIPNGPRKSVGIGLIDSGVTMTVAGQQYIPVDCGSRFIKNFSGSYLDYDPYTKVEIFLPYIGTRTLKADEVVGHNLHVGYWVDILSGACTAWLDADGVPLYQFMGQCATALPMASGEWTSLINGIIGAVGSVAAGAASGGIGGAIAGGVAAASAVAVNDGKIQVERSGAVTSASGLMGLQKPTLFISAPHLHKPAAQNTFEGYPAYFTSKLSDLEGFTTIENIRLQGIPATEPELQEIETLLKGGVIL